VRLQRLSSGKSRGDKLLNLAEIIDAKPFNLRFQLVQPAREIVQPSVTAFQNWRAKQGPHFGDCGHDVARG
jgi:hypothetical protein